MTYSLSEFVLFVLLGAFGVFLLTYGRRGGAIVIVLGAFALAVSLEWLLYGVRP